MFNKDDMVLRVAASGTDEFRSYIYGSITEHRCDYADYEICVVHDFADKTLEELKAIVDPEIESFCKSCEWNSVQYIDDDLQRAIDWWKLVA